MSDDTATEGTHYLNVDVEVRSTEDLTQLVTGLIPAAFVVHSDHDDRGYYVVLELARDEHLAANEVISEFVALISHSPIHHNAQLTFNVGIKAGVVPHEYEVTIQAATIRALAEINGTLIVTIYGAAP